MNYPRTDISINIIGKIEELSHQDYNGKRVYIEVKDKKHNKIETKLDIGVHKNFDIEQDEYCFDLNNINESVTLLINSKEQIFTEKLKSLLKFGFVSTRYKDIFDFYYLINNKYLNKDKLLKCFYTFIFTDETMKEDNLEELVKNYGLVIVDECHHVATYSFEKVLKAVRSKHVYGLTATPTRKDGWHKIIYMQCGDIIK